MNEVDFTQAHTILQIIITRNTEKGLQLSRKQIKSQNNEENCAETQHMMMMMISASSSSSVPHFPKSSLDSKPTTPFNKIKNPKIFLGFSNVHSLTHLCVDSPSRASVKCFSQGEKEEKQQAVQIYEFERLFSNLNQATLQREPGINP